MPAETLVRSIRGVPFRSNKSTVLLRSNGLVEAIGRVAQAEDNTAMRLCFALTLEIVLNRQAWSTRKAPSRGHYLA